LNLQVTIALGTLQRLIALRAVPSQALPQILSTMTEIMTQGVDIQLKILQALLSLVTSLPDVHGDTLGDVRLFEGEIGTI
jgi:Dimerisation and cyclophilin-binding domain of Mon2